MIPVYALAVGLVWSVRAAPIGMRLRRLMGRAPEQPAEGPKAEGLMDDGKAYTLTVRVAGLLLSVIGLVTMWVTIHAAMARGAAH